MRRPRAQGDEAASAVRTACSQAADICRLLMRGAVLDFGTDPLPWPRMNTCDLCRYLVLTDCGALSVWQRHDAEAGEWAHALVGLLILAWTANPRLLADQTYLSGDVCVNLVRLLFEPALTRCGDEHGWELRIDERCKADLFFRLTPTIVQLLQINEDGDIERRCHTKVTPYSYRTLLYEAAAQCILPQADWCLRFGVRGRMTLNNYRPLDEAHRHQQQSLCRLLLNRYRTATHGLFAPPASHAGGGSGDRPSEQQRQNIEMIGQHARCDARVPTADLRRIWAEVREDSRYRYEALPDIFPSVVFKLR